MSSVNKVLLIGHLGSSPELRYTASGSCVCNLSLATSERWKDAGGQREKTEWHRVVVWGEQAKACAEHLHKGSQCYCEGKLQTRSWTAKDGSRRYTTEIVANVVLFLDGRGGAQPEEGPDEQPGQEGSGDIPF